MTTLSIGLSVDAGAYEPRLADACPGAFEWLPDGTPPGYVPELAAAVTAYLQREGRGEEPLFLAEELAAEDALLDVLDWVAARPISPAPESRRTATAEAITDVQGLRAIRTGMSFGLRFRRFAGTVLTWV